MKPITENHIEQSAIEILQSQGWDYVNGKVTKIANKRKMSNLHNKKEYE